MDQIKLRRERNQLVINALVASMNSKITDLGELYPCQANSPSEMVFMCRKHVIKFGGLPCNNCDMIEIEATTQIMY